MNVENGAPWSALSCRARTSRRPRVRARKTFLRLPRTCGTYWGRSAQAPFETKARGTYRSSCPSLSLLTEGLGLPLYVCDLQGRFIYASPAFLQLTGYPSLEALAQSRELFREPEKRAAELETVRKRGKVESFRLSMTRQSGTMLQVRDSAVSRRGFHPRRVLRRHRAAGGQRGAEGRAAGAGAPERQRDGRQRSSSQRTQGAAIRSLARLAEYRDPETGFHLQRICEYTRLIAMQVHLRAPFTFRITMEYVNDISHLLMLHDIGKVSIPDHILLKPGKLDPDEWETMKKHTVFGWEVLHKADRELGEQSFLTLAASIALLPPRALRREGVPEWHRRRADPPVRPDRGDRRRLRRAHHGPSLQGGLEPRAGGG